MPNCLDQARALFRGGRANDWPRHTRGRIEGNAGGVGRGTLARGAGWLRLGGRRRAPPRRRGGARSSRVASTSTRAKQDGGVSLDGVRPCARRRAPGTRRERRVRMTHRVRAHACRHRTSRIASRARRRCVARTLSSRGGRVCRSSSPRSTRRRARRASLPRVACGTISCGSTPRGGGRCPSSSPRSRRWTARGSRRLCASPARALQRPPRSACFERGGRWVGATATAAPPPRRWRGRTTAPGRARRRTRCGKSCTPWRTRVRSTPRRSGKPAV